MFTIALVCQKGGAGKTTLAVHLAIEAHRRGAKTLVIDLDQQASAAKVLDRRGEDPPDVVTEQPGRLEVTIAEAKRQGYDIVVLDTEPHAGQGALRAARSADLVLVPFRPSIVDLDAVQASLEICAIANRKPVFILNAISPRGQEVDEARIVVSNLGGLVATATLGDRKAFRTAFNEGRGAQEIEPKGKASAEITALFNDLNIPTSKTVHKPTRKSVVNSTRKLVEV